MAAPDEFELEPEWDSVDSNRFQARVEAGEIDQYGEPRRPGFDEWGLPCPANPATAPPSER